MFSQHRNFVTPSEKEIRLQRKADVFLNEAKDWRKRYTSLLSFLASASDDDQQVFFQANYWRIFSVFREAFAACEASFRSKAAREKDLSQELQKEMDGLLMVLAKILHHLPNLIKKLWQHRAIAQILMKLLNHQNVLEWRRKGLRLLLTWLSCLCEKSPAIAIWLFRHSMSMVPCTQDSALSERMKQQETRFLFDMGMQSPLVPQLTHRKEEPIQAIHTLTTDIIQYMYELVQNEGITIGKEPCKASSKSQFSPKCRSLVWLFELWKKNHLTSLFNKICRKLNIRPTNCSQPPGFIWTVDMDTNPTDTTYLPTATSMRPIPGAAPQTPAPVGSDAVEEVVEFNFKMLEEVILPWLQQMLEARYGPWYVMRCFVLRSYTNRALINDILQQAYLLPFPEEGTPSFDTRYRQMMFPTSMYFRWASDPTWPESETTVCDDDLKVNIEQLNVGRQAQLRICIRSTSLLLNRACVIENKSTASTSNLFMMNTLQQDTHEMMCRYVLSFYHSLCIGEIRESTVLIGTGARIMGALGVSWLGGASDGEFVYIGSQERLGNRSNAISSGAANSTIGNTAGQTMPSGVGNTRHNITTAGGAASATNASVQNRSGVYGVELELATWRCMQDTLLSILDSMLSDQLYQTRQADSVASRLRVRMIQTVLRLWVRSTLCNSDSNDQIVWKQFMTVMEKKVKWRDIVLCWKGEMAWLTKMMSLHLYGIDFDNLPLNTAKKTRRAILRERKNEEDDQSSTELSHQISHAYNAGDDGVHIGTEGEAGGTMSEDDLLRTPAILLEVESLQAEWERTFRLFDDAEETTRGVVDRPATWGGNNMKMSAITASTMSAPMDGELCKQTWTPTKAVYLWANMLVLLGNVNAMHDGTIHADAQQCLHAITTQLATISDNQGVMYTDSNGQVLYSPVVASPLPVYDSISWVFEACAQKDPVYLKGRQIAYRHLCLIICKRRKRPPSSTILAQTYILLNEGLMDPSTEVLGEILTNTTGFFSIGLPGCSVLLPSYLDAISRVVQHVKVCSPELRRAALTIVGTVLYLPMLYGSEDMVCMPRSASVAPSEDRGNTDVVGNGSTGAGIGVEVDDSGSRNTENFGEIHPRLVQQTIFDILKNSLCVETDPENTCIALASVGSLLHFYFIRFTQIEQDSLTCSKETYTPSPSHASSGESSFSRAGSFGKNDEEKALSSQILLLIDTLLSKLEVASPKHIVSDMVVAQLSLLPDVIAPYLNPNSTSSTNVNNNGTSTDLCKLSYRLYTLVMAQLSKAVMSSLSVLPTGEEDGRLKNRRITRYLFSLMEWAMISPNTAAGYRTSNEDVSAHCEAGSEGSFDREQDELGHHSIDAVFTVVKACIQAPQHRHGDSTHPTPQSMMYVPDSLGPGHNKAQAEIFHSPASPSTTSHTRDTRDTIGSHEISQTATFVLFHLINNFSNFPPTAGVARLTSKISEDSDVIVDNGTTKKRDAVLGLAGVQFFVFNETTLISCVEMPGANLARIILRDLTGKHAWDCTVQYEDAHDSVACRPTPQLLFDSTQTLHTSQSCPTHGLKPSIRRKSTAPYVVQEQARRWLQAPTWSTIENPTSVDMLDTLLIYLGDTSKECRRVSGARLNLPANPPAVMGRTEQHAVSSLRAQAKQEAVYLAQCQTEPHVNQVTKSVTQDEFPTAQSSFQYCRMILSYLGFLSWENRRHFHLLEKSQRLLGDLRVLDNTSSREHHKVGVVFVGYGQEDEAAILSNTTGSDKYERFLQGLGWEVRLDIHLGFIGGLLRDGKDGITTPYYANHTVEVVYHVATRMPNNQDDKNLRKKKHIGNDEVQIFWCEHWRDYRLDLIRTKFNEAVIVIYPLENGLYRVSVIRGPKVPRYGPLADEMIVPQSALASLVRATAICAGRTMREQASSYVSFYRQREMYISEIVGKYKVNSQFEEFMETVIQPHADDEG